MSVSKRRYYESTIRSTGFVTERLVEETGMAPEALDEVISGYFAEVTAGAEREPGLPPAAFGSDV
jgi:hypothetical protein